MGALSLPQIGLTSLRARTYSHRLGLAGERLRRPLPRSLIQPDPIGQAGGINLYDYAGGDPVNGWDPWGLCGTRLPGHAAAGCVSFLPQNPSKSAEEEHVVVARCRGMGCLEWWETIGFQMATRELQGIPEVVSRWFERPEGGQIGEDGRPLYCSSETWQKLDQAQKLAQAAQIAGGATALGGFAPGAKVAAVGSVVDVGAAFGKRFMGDRDALNETFAGILISAGPLKFLSMMSDIPAVSKTGATTLASLSVSSIIPPGPCE